MANAEFLNLIRRHLKYLKSSEAVNPNQSLKSLGLDSMGAIDLLFDIEDTYGLTLPEKYLTEETFSTAHSLWAVIEHLKGDADTEGRSEYGYSATN
jgi:acyl carrier protein